MNFANFAASIKWFYATDRFQYIPRAKGEVYSQHSRLFSAPINRAESISIDLSADKNRLNIGIETNRDQLSRERLAQAIRLSFDLGAARNIVCDDTKFFIVEKDLPSNAPVNRSGSTVSISIPEALLPLEPLTIQHPYLSIPKINGANVNAKSTPVSSTVNVVFNYRGGGY
jgi:hypothetical protein